MFVGFGQLKTKPIKANLFRIAYCVLRIAERKKAKMSVNLEFFDYFLVFIRNTIFQNVAFYARFLFWPIVTYLYVVPYEAFLLDELFGCGQGRSPRLRQVNSWLIWKNKANFRMVRMSLSIYMKGDYEDFNAFGLRKNKANSKPNRQERIAGQVW